MPVPPVEAIHLEGPEPGPEVAHDHQTIAVTHIHTPQAIEDALAVLDLVEAGIEVQSRFQRTAMRVIVADRVGIGRVHQVHHLEPVVERRDEVVRPTQLVVM